MKIYTINATTSVSVYEHPSIRSFPDLVIRIGDSATSTTISRRKAADLILMARREKQAKIVHPVR
jgi:hypothetical protein